MVRAGAGGLTTLRCLLLLRAPGRCIGAALLLGTGRDRNFLHAAFCHGLADLLDFADHGRGEFAFEIVRKFLHHIVCILHRAADDTFGCSSRFSSLCGDGLLRRGLMLGCRQMGCLSGRGLLWLASMHLRRGVLLCLLNGNGMGCLLL